MRQFDILENPNEASRSYAPFVVVLQSHHLDPLDTVFVAPLVRHADRVLTRLDIAVEVHGERLVIVIAEAAGLPRRGFGRPIRSVDDHSDEILRAIQRLITGF